MNLRDPADHAVAHWLQQFPYPNCRKANTLAALRSGVAIAEVLLHKLPPSTHPLFLPNIEIYNLTPQRSVMNLKVLLGTLKAYYSGHEELSAMLEEFTAEGLYFDHNMMETFIHTVLMPLEAPADTPPNQLVREYCPAHEEASDLANLSSIIVHNHESRPQEPQTRKSPKQKDCQEEKESPEMQKIKKWLWDAHHIDANEQEPEIIMGRLVNSIFAGSRLDHAPIVKQSHYELGSLTVFKKACDYLLECERMPKQNVLTLKEEVEEGSIREEVFWAVIEDLMSLKASHHLKTSRSRRKSLTKTQEETHSNKENEPKEVNIIKEAVQTKSRVVNAVEYSPSALLSAENWIKNELGYDFSLNKSKTADKMEENPLLNGVLLGSIIMRLQIGKINTIKQPKNKKEIEKNITEVVNSVIRRGIESGRKFASLKPTYNNYLGILWDIKSQHERKMELDKLKRMEKHKERKEAMRQMTELERESLNGWLQERGVQLENYPYLPPATVSEFCGQALELRLLRETTSRIRQINMAKILSELRRVGWQSDCSCGQVLSAEGNGVRWSMVRFMRELLRYKVYYYR